MTGRSTAQTIDQYIAVFPPATRAVLREMRELIRSTAPEAVETMSYGMPTFDLHGRHLVHFAGYERHLGFYPTASGVAAFEGELAPYRHAKGSVRFPLDEPLPHDLIRRIVEHRLATVKGGGR